MADWLAGEARATPKMVLAMLRALPEEAAFVAHMRVEAEREPDVDADGVPIEIDPELSSFLEKKTWTEDRRLLADIANRLGLIFQYLHQWEKGQEPKLPILGPSEWREQAEVAEQKSKLVTIDDVLGALTRSRSM